MPEKKSEKKAKKTLATAPAKDLEQFFSLTADRILDSVEEALGERATGRALALNSLENRVYEVELEDTEPVVTKFYRPGRWSMAQISEEHLFLEKLKSLEIPVVSPLVLKNGKTLATSEDGIIFCVFPKVRGRLVDELTKSHLEILGRYLGRIHNIGSRFPLKHRLRLSAEIWGWDSLETILQSPLCDESLKPRYREVAERFLRMAEPLIKNAKAQTVHGDCHLGNTLWNGDSPFFLDFDDLMTAPAVQDLWMIVRGRDEQAQADREVLISTYEQMFEFDRSSLSLIEPLRGLRILHYSAWIIRRWDDPSFPKAFPHFKSLEYWRSEMEALTEICDFMDARVEF